MFSAPLALAAAKQFFIMLRPDIQWRHPVMFVVEVGAALTLAFIVHALFAAGSFPAGYAETQYRCPHRVGRGAWGCARS